MAEVIVFLIVGCIAIVSAALMLISQNAVHSALFLVLNFACVAFFFLTLGAPFIALVQIAVYAGAIMVLFLFVIMLLGAERMAPGPGPYRWLPRAAIALGLIFLITAGGALASGQINLQAAPPAMPQVRVLHAADAPPVDVYLNNQLIFDGVNFRDLTGYSSLPAGEYGVTVFPAGADPAAEAPAILGDLILADGDSTTLVALGGSGLYQITRLEDKPLPAADEQARVTLLNGLPEAGPVDLVDPGVPSLADDSRVMIANARFGEQVETLLLRESGPLTWEILPHTEGEAGTPAAPIATFRDLEFKRYTNNLLIVAAQTLANGQTRTVPLVITVPTQMPYGSPQQIGQVLFTQYLLPFQLVAVLLLVAMIGAITLTQRELAHERRPRRPIVRRPLVGPQAASALAANAPEERDVEALLEPDKPASD